MEMVKILLCAKSHYGLIFSDQFVQYLSETSPEIIDIIELELIESLMQDEAEMLEKYPEWNDKSLTIEEYTLNRYNFTKLKNGKIAQPKWDLTIVRTNPEVLKYVLENGSASFKNTEIPFEIIEVPINEFAGVYEEDDGSECVNYIHPAFVRNKT